MEPCGGVPGLQDPDVIAVNEVDEAVFFADPARPGSGEGVRQRFGLAHPSNGVAYRTPVLPDAGEQARRSGCVL